MNEEGAAQPTPSTSATTSTTASSLLAPETLHGIMPLDLRARIVADALFAGGHRSRRFGSSTEFAEHKVYTPGDDLRRLDWRVMGRLDKSYVRRTEDETRRRQRGICTMTGPHLRNWCRQTHRHQMRATEAAPCSRRDADDVDGRCSVRHHESEGAF